MAYNRRITSNEPGLVLLLLDQSGSMGDPFGSAAPEEGNVSKAETLAKTVNRLFRELVEANVGGTGLKDRFHFGVLGYGGSGVETAFQGAFSKRDLVPLTELANGHLRIDKTKKRVPDGDGGVIEIEVEVPIWVEARASGGTPMVAALKKAYQITSAWAAQHQDSFPPIILNITDGEATDTDSQGPIEVAADALKTISTADGNALVFNCHLSSDRSGERMFPDSEAGLPNDLACTLFRASSVLPDPCIEEAKKQKLPIQPGARGFAFNASAVALTSFINIGTPTGPNR